MTLGEIKCEALKLMGMNDSEITSEMISNLISDARFAEFLTRMPGSINRCFSDIESKRILPVKSMTLHNPVNASCDYLVKFDLTQISDLRVPEGVAVMTASGYDNDCRYIFNGAEILVDKIQDATYTLRYQGKITRVSAGNDNDGQIDLPDEIAALVPYFVKSDLFRIDEPGEAGEARNIYESGIAEYKAARQGDGMRQTGVVTVYGG